MVVLVGTTGAGKTKLSVDLCKAAGGEVINADCLQMYKELSVATAKVTAEESGGVPHQLLSFLEPWEDYTVTDFRASAMEHVSALMGRGRLPIVVGGTGYYVQSLLRPSLLDELCVPLESEPAAIHQNSATGASEAAPGSTSEAAREAALVGSKKRPRSDGGVGAPGTGTSELQVACEQFARLCKLDPVAARKLHPGNGRRVRAAIALAESTGVASSVLASRQREQASARLGEAIAGSADKPLTSVIWVDAAKDVLDARLNSRVGGMLQQGLLIEIEAVRSYARAAGRNPDTGHAIKSPSAPNREGPIGAFIAIGYKELIPYFRHLEQLRVTCADHPLAMATVSRGEAALDLEPGAKRASPAAASPSAASAAADSAGCAASAAAADWSEADELLRGCVAELQQHTRQYAKDQLRWIRRRFHDRGVRLCRVDSTDPSQWHRDALVPALAEIESLQAAVQAAARMQAGQGVETEDEALVNRHIVPPDSVTAEVDATWAKYRCRVCDSVFNGRTEWDSHTHSRAHQSRIASLRKLGKNLLSMTANLRRQGRDEAEITAQIASVDSFRKLGDESRAEQLVQLGRGKPPSSVVDLPWPAEDGIPAGEVSDAALAALGRLILMRDGCEH